METIISIGAGEMQFEFIKKLKEKGYCVAALGHGKNSASAMEMCDYFADIDTRDVNSAIIWLDSIKKENNVEYVGAGSYAGGAAIKTLQYITNYYNLPTAVPSELIVGMDKYKQQLMYENYNLSGIRTYRAADLYNNCTNICTQERYIIKPSVGRGSEGIEFISGDDLICRIKDKLLNSEDIVQKVISGSEYRMLMMVQNNKIKLLMPILRTSYVNSVFLGRLEMDYSKFPKIMQHAYRIVKNLNLNNAIAKYDLLVNDSEVNLIELDIGVGGGYYFKKYISLVTNTDIMDMYIDMLVGHEIPQVLCNNLDLVMDYIYNNHENEIKYNYEECREMLTKALGDIVILVNRLHPERKGKYKSNADFVFTVIHRKNELSTLDINQMVNDICFYEA